MEPQVQHWLFGWDETPGIVSVWAELDGRAWVWRRGPGGGGLLLERVRFEPWLLLASLADLAHLGDALVERDETAAEQAGALVTYQELDGPGALRFLVRARDGRALIAALLQGASRRLGRSIGHVRELDRDQLLMLPAEEQYLVASGRTYFKQLQFDDLRRLQFDLETTGLDPVRDRVFLIALRDPDGATHVLEAAGAGDADEAALLQQFVARVRSADPDVIENHNLHGFDLPFLVERAARLRVSLALGRVGGAGLRQRPASRGARLGGTRSELRARMRYTIIGRESIDTHDAVLRHDFSARDLPGHGLKAVARHFGVSPPAREYIAGARVAELFTRDPERVRRYACDDVVEAAAIARLLGGASFALARMAPRRYERLADAGPATGVLDPLLARAYLHAGHALPAHQSSDGTPHSGAALYLFAAGVARRIVKADVASLYPSLMRTYAIGPRSDRLGVLLAVVDRLVEERLLAKAQARRAPLASAERFGHEALSAAMKIVVNSAYGYLGAAGLTRFADVHAANDVTRRGRELLALLCRELGARGVTLLQADTDGVYFAVPEHFDEAAERRVVAEVAALLPARVQLEFDGRYAAMLSHEPKNYALQPYGAGPIVLRGVAFHSRRSEPFGQDFLRRALPALLSDDLVALREIYLQSADAIRRRALPVAAVAARVRLTKAPDEYLAQRSRRRELPYEAVLASGRTRWSPGERVRVYRASGGRPVLLPELDADEPDLSTADGQPSADGTSAPRDYDRAYYLRVLRDTFAARFQRALTPHDFAAVFADSEQISLFEPDLGSARTVLTAVTAVAQIEATSADPEEPGD